MVTNLWLNKKKAKYRALIKAKENSKEFTSLTTITKYFNLKRDAYYKYKNRNEKRLKIEKQVIQIVQQKRKFLPREGVRKLKKYLQKEFTNANVKIRRDTLFNILRKHNMLTIRKKPTFETTNSMHRFYKYKNIIKDLEVTKPNQVWVSDHTLEP